MGKIIAQLSPGQAAGHDPWAWGSKCRPNRAGITGREDRGSRKMAGKHVETFALKLGKKCQKNGNILCCHGNG